MQPKPQVQMSISTGITDGHDVAQWIQNEDVTGDGVTDYVYGELDRNVVSVTARGTYAFTRDMTLEVYLQPFVAVGDYFNIRRLAAPMSFEFEPVTIERQPRLQQQVAAQQRRVPLGVPPRQHAVPRLQRLEQRRLAPRRVLGVSRPAQRLRRRRHAGANGQI